MFSFLHCVLLVSLFQLLSCVVQIIHLKTIIRILRQVLSNHPTVKNIELRDTETDHSSSPTPSDDDDDYDDADLHLAMAMSLREEEQKRMKEEEEELQRVMSLSLLDQ